MRRVMRRYISAAKTEELRMAGQVEFTPTGARSYNVITTNTTEFYTVADDDPRLDTVEDVTDERPLLGEYGLL